MPELLLLRHAKSSWADSSLDDIDRPLNKRGVKASAAMGREMDRLALAPRLVLCSPAKRTRETIELAAEQCPALRDYRVINALYGASVRGVIDMLRAVDPACPSVMVVGHNPTTQMLALALTEGEKGVARDKMTVKYPTGALAQIHFECEWRAVGTGAGQLVRFVRPRDL